MEIAVQVNSFAEIGFPRTDPLQLRIGPAVWSTGPLAEPVAIAVPHRQPMVDKSFESAELFAIEPGDITTHPGDNQRGLAEKRLQSSLLS